MNNMNNIIKAHNNKIMNANNSHREYSCNCRQKENCPLPNKCQAESVIYQATVTSNNSTKQYIGLTANPFKKRFDVHKNSFNDKENRNSTDLSNHIWNLKDNNTPYKITWKIITHAKPYSPNTKRCNLCLSEKYYIITANRTTSLNTRSELISTCRHRKKYLLSESNKPVKLKSHNKSTKLIHK